MGNFKNLKQEIENNDCRFLNRDSFGNIYCRASECYDNRANCSAKDNIFTIPELKLLILKLKVASTMQHTYPKMGINLYIRIMIRKKKLKSLLKKLERLYAEKQKYSS